MGPGWGMYVGDRTVQRWREEHRSNSYQTRRRLQAHRIERVLRRVVSPHVVLVRWYRRGL